MEKVRPWCGQPSDRGRLQNGTEQNILSCLLAHYRLTGDVCRQRCRQAVRQLDALMSGLLTCDCDSLVVRSRDVTERARDVTVPRDVTERCERIRARFRAANNLACHGTCGRRIGSRADSRSTAVGTMQHSGLETGDCSRQGRRIKIQTDYIFPE